MPVWKYRDVSEMPPPPRAIGEEDIARRVRALWRRTVRLAPIGYPPGVHRFHTIEEAQAARERNRLERRRARDRRG